MIFEKIRFFSLNQTKKGLVVRSEPWTCWLRLKENSRSIYSTLHQITYAKNFFDKTGRLCGCHVCFIIMSRRQVLIPCQCYNYLSSYRKTVPGWEITSSPFELCRIPFPNHLGFTRVIFFVLSVRDNAPLMRDLFTIFSLHNSSNYWLVIMETKTRINNITVMCYS